MLCPVEAGTEVVDKPSKQGVSRQYQEIRSAARACTDFPGNFSLIFLAKYRACSRSGFFVSSQRRSEYGANASTRLMAPCEDARMFQKCLSELCDKIYTSVPALKW